MIINILAIFTKVWILLTVEILTILYIFLFGKLLQNLDNISYGLGFHWSENISCGDNVSFFISSLTIYINPIIGDNTNSI